MLKKVLGAIIGIVIGLAIGLMVIKPMVSDFVTGKIEEATVKEAVATFEELGYEIEKVEGTSLLMMTPDGKVAIDLDVIEGTFWTTSSELNEIWSNLG